ncbi:MAG TPA: thioredoxin domain-containing protein [Candidatus Peribacteraceae bacterium]|nr:thioredoxin domain-containing protein [Candidatus Peribacteraceae bacterium]
MKNLLIIITACTLTLAGCVKGTGQPVASSRSAHPGSNPNASVTVVEYADLQCPACRATNEQVVKPLLSQYGDRIRYEYRHFPLSSIHQYAFPAAEAAECAADQDRFWEFIEKAYERQDELDESALSDWAASLDIDMDLFRQCVQSRMKRQIVLSDYKEGRKAGVKGTPSFFVNGEKVPHDLSSLSSAINQLTNPPVPL